MKKLIQLLALSLFSVPILPVVTFIPVQIQAKDIWIQRADIGITGNTNDVGFSIGGKGCIGTGFSDQLGFWEYDPTTNAWTQKADFGGVGRASAVGFSINGKSYIGTGQDYEWVSDECKDFWQYDPVANEWTQKADFGGTKRTNAFGFSIGDKGYIGGGGRGSSTHFIDFWEYDPWMDQWIQKADIPVAKRTSAVGFSIGSKGYMGTGIGIDSHEKDFWEYDPLTNTWTQKADFGGTGRNNAIGFSIGTKGYIGTGVKENHVNTKDFWEYDPYDNAWTQKADFGGSERQYSVGFSIDNKGYIGTGGIFMNNYKDFWEYTPAGPCLAPLNPETIDVTSTSAKATWDYATTPITFKVRYKEAGTTSWSTKGVDGTKHY